MRMAVQKHIPQKLVPLTMQAFPDHQHAIAQSDGPHFWIPESGRPGCEPFLCRSSMRKSMEQCCQEVRLAQSAFANNDDRPAVRRSRGFKPLQDIVSGVSDLKKILGGNLCRACLIVIGELNGRPLQPFSPELLPQFQAKHPFSLPVPPVLFSRPYLNWTGISPPSIQFTLSYLTCGSNDATM
jgi:hypothetical protein